MAKLEELENDTLRIELELTTKCNAACPQCVRNFYGGPKWPSLPLIAPKLDYLKDKLGNILSNVSTIKLCGTYGDPCVHNQFIDIVTWLKTYPNLSVRINTNGGMNKKHWTKLAKLLTENDLVTFGIDGLSDTNHLYRKNVDWDTLMKNVKDFIGAGGPAAWQFIVFEHNQHQVEEAKALSINLGFKYFFVKKTIRFFNKNHEKVDFTPSVDKNKIFIIKPPTDTQYLYSGYKNIKNVDFKTVPIKCIGKHFHHIYVGADGYVFPCGWLHDRLYGYEPEKHSDHEKIFKLMDIAGGKEKANINYTPIEQIIYGDWFRVLEDSWSNENRLERCAAQCHVGNSMIEDVYHLANENT